MTLLAIKTFLGAIPGWIYAGLLVLVLAAAGAWHLISQRNEARESLRLAREEIVQLNNDLTTSRANVATLEDSIKKQNDSIAMAGKISEARQAETQAALAKAAAREREQQARIAALKAVQASGDRTQGANYAFDARRKLP